MNRERAAKVVLVVVGLLFVASIYPIVMYLWHPGNESPGDTMMLSLYFALGIFLLMAVRNPAEHRSLISFAAWGNFAHGAVMLVMAFRIPSGRGDFLVASAIVMGIALALIVVAPGKPTVERESVASA
jgi:uncharacterized membrane protein HdeD (DUF308 family)